MAGNVWTRTLGYLYFEVALILNGVASVSWFTLDDPLTYYYLGESQLNHADAIQFCLSVGGGLVRLQSKEIADELARRLPNGVEYYIDLDDTVQEGTFRYSNGGVPSWTKWKKGEPNDKPAGKGSQSADCVVYKLGSGMYDRDCLDTYMYICYKEVPSTTVSMTSKIEAVTSTTEQLTSTPEAVTSTVEVMTSTTEDGMSTTEDVTSRTEAVTATTDDVTSTTEAVTSTTDDVTSTTEDMTSRTEAVTSTATGEMSTIEATPNALTWTSESMTKALTRITETVTSKNVSWNHVTTTEAASDTGVDTGYILQWNTWISWTECTVKCGPPGGIKYRIKLCSEQGTYCTHSILLHNGLTLGYGVQAAVCNDMLCPQDGVWLPWLSWSECSATCGQSIARRERKCLPPSHGGKPCNGSENEYRMCEDQQCPVYKRRFELSQSFTDSDYRPSAVAIGTTGSLILGLIGMTVLCIDIPVIMKHLRYKFSTSS